MKKPEVYQLFVYGSLRSGFRSPAYEYVSRYFDLLGDAKVKGEKAFGFLVGQTMKELKGKGNPQVINEILKRELIV